MQNQAEKTIAAVATPVGGGIAVIRISGADAPTVADVVWRGRKRLATATPFCMMRGKMVDESGQHIDDGMAVCFPVGKSYTGEPVVELHCHGNSYGVRAVLQALYKAGASPAAPGEFTRRAFLNGKMDLTQAEAVADVIGAKSRAALVLAENQLRGALAAELLQLYGDLVDLLSDIESRLDFTEEDLDWWSAGQLATRFATAQDKITQLLATQHRGMIMRHGVRVVLAGAPNAGKSSLLNTMLGRARAIVTDIPGTTRDVLEEGATINGIPVILQDTAGLRQTDDTLERIGIERTWHSVLAADVVLWVMDVTAPLASQLPAAEITGRVWMPVFNKIDCATPDLLTSWQAAVPVAPVLTCAVSGQGLDDLYNRVEALACQQDDGPAELAINERHALELQQAMTQLSEAAGQGSARAWECAAIGVRGAVHHVGQILGKTCDPDILDRIFTRFCIGK